MTTATVPAPSTRADAPSASSAYRLSFGHLLRSEWIKLTTLRSTWWSIGLVALVSIGLSLLMATSLASFAGDVPPMPVVEANRQAVQVVVFSTVLTQLLAMILGTITVTGEYSTGMIRSTLTAAPGRVAALFAKAIVLAVTMFVSSVVVFTAAALVSGPILPTGPLDLGYPDSSVLPVLGAALYLALIAVMGVGVGFIIRNGPGALAAGIGLVFVAPILVMFFPRVESFQWIHDAAGYLPSNAGQSLFMGSPMTGITLEPAPALVTVLAWTAVVIAGGIAVLKTRDA
ncbi:ABC transporter permease [Microbacterium gallinarum]|jgi:ABC-2 type transport system permease protein|uniref:ABC transporter permease n=1 Tax=Microbacterium gallinarum TaxID=2762209 RepID=A0ABR8X5D1_9MICO|nr:ABC transporter permease [Microbacterium gallinarum]MBD8024533.1 ABC transporter permease [Microbacterium gallinarum]